LSGIRMCFVEPNKLDGWLSLRWFWTTNLSTRSKSWMSDLPVHSCLLVSSWPRAPRGCTFQTFSSTPLLAILLLPFDVFSLSHFHAPLPHMHPWYACKTKSWLPPHACTLHVVW
jgi:hypothetical protein